MQRLFPALALALILALAPLSALADELCGLPDVMAAKMRLSEAALKPFFAGNATEAGAAAPRLFGNSLNGQWALGVIGEDGRLCILWTGAAFTRYGEVIPGLNDAGEKPGGAQ